MSEVEPATAWRVCRTIRGECDQCPSHEDFHGEPCVRGCYAQAVECVNVVETGNPWRKTSGVSPPWATLQSQARRVAEVEALLREVQPRCREDTPHRCASLGGTEPGSDWPCCRVRSVLSEGEKGSSRDHTTTCECDDSSLRSDATGDEREPWRGAGCALGRVEGGAYRACPYCHAPEGGACRWVF